MWHWNYIFHIIQKLSLRVSELDMSTRQIFVDWRVCSGNRFLFISFISESVWYVGFYKIDTLELPALQLTGFWNSWCIDKEEREQTAPCQDRVLMTEEKMTFISCKPFSESTTSLLCFQVISFRENHWSSLWNFVTLWFFCFAGFLWENVLYIPDKLFRARLKEKTFAFLEKRLENLESREILCIHRIEIVTVSAGPR